MFPTPPSVDTVNSSPDGRQHHLSKINNSGQYQQSILQNHSVYGNENIFHKPMHPEVNNKYLTIPLTMTSAKMNYDKSPVLDNSRTLSNAKSLQTNVYFKSSISKHPMPEEYSRVLRLPSYDDNLQLPHYGYYTPSWQVSLWLYLFYYDPPQIVFASISIVLLSVLQISLLPAC